MIMIVLAEIGFLSILILTGFIAYRHFSKTVTPAIHRNNKLIEYTDKIIGDVLIKPCPYCGKLPHIEREDKKITISCKAKNHITKVSAFNAEEAVTFWNNRDFVEDVSIL